MLNKAFILSLILAIILPFENQAQDITLLLKEAQHYETKFNERDALQKYLEILRLQPRNFGAICKASELHALLGRRQASREKQNEFYETAKIYALQAVRLNPNSAEANFVMAFALGRIALISSGEEKIDAVKDIRSYAEKTIRLDPSHYKAYHVLGRWHYEVSDLNTVERWLLKMAYGSLPKSSLEMAIRYYEKSRQLNPGFLLNYLELAKAYSRKDQDRKAIDLLNTMMKLPPSSASDGTIKAEGRKMLEELN